jgi:hypothetical protein
MSARMKEWKFLGLVVALLFIVGVALLVLASYNREHQLTHDILRDLGIAFIISALVTLAYEIYARTRFDLAKIETLLDTVYGSGIPPRIWDSIKDTLLSRRVLRQDSVLHLRVERDPSVGTGNVVLELDLSYDLLNLLPKEHTYEVVHGLDEHIATAHLPHFLEASVGECSDTIGGSDPWQSKKCDMSVEKGRLLLRVPLPAAKENTAVPVRITRHEFRWCPGSYYLIMSEITDRFRVYLDECAEDVNVTLFLYPAALQVDLTANHIAIINEPLLPGYCLEFKLTTRSVAKDAPPADKAQ